ncbi:ABC transporter permease [Carboxylicivirga sp. RSCT41]|uniref:ABC transporter permease n=1 Tax=Carboxylicivirga agarovorans TaxID=3417570 RepID=UPI003D341E20
MIYYKQIFKSILKYKTHTGLTLLSLLVSFSGIIILALYISHEWSFDDFHDNKDQLYRLETVMYANNLPAQLADFVEKDIPEVEDLTVFCFDGHDAVTTPSLNEQNICISSTLITAQNSLFHLFSFPLKEGNINTVLTEPNTVVLSESMAYKLYGDRNPLGETLLYEKRPFRVEAVMYDIPENSSFKADCLFSFATIIQDKSKGVDSWEDWSFNIFLKTSARSHYQEIARKIDTSDKLPEIFGGLKEQYPGQTFFKLTPLADIHYQQGNLSSNYVTINPIIIDILLFLIVILAIMGIVNFINFSTAQAPLRAKALSISQVMGASRINSMQQLILESIVVSLIAMVISFVFYNGIYRFLESFFGIDGLSLEGRPRFLLGFGLFAILYGIIAGLYPSIYITSSPVFQSVKGNAYFRGKGRGIRNSLVTLQFVFTIVLIVSAFTVEKQLNYWRNYDLGINKEHVVYLHTNDELKEHHQAFVDELLMTDMLDEYAYTQFAPGQVGMGWGREVDGQFIQFMVWPVDNNFIDFFDIEIAEGRSFSENNKTDINNFILNQKAVEIFKWDNPLERNIEGFDKAGQVVGVANDINFSSLKDEMQPMVFWRTEERKDVLLLRLKPGNYTQAIQGIRQIALQFDPQYLGEVKFLEEELQRQYQKEEKTARFIEFIAIWCVLLAIAGILGLMIFVARDRVKEIGIRKVNGAKVLEILALLNVDFIKWVLIAFVIACPLAWLAMDRWLENFAYKTGISWWIFALAGIVALAIALITVSWQSWKAANRNPVEALRYE